MQSQNAHPLDVRTFRASSLREALSAIREQLGPDADIRRTREVPAGGLWNRLTGKTVIEITASASDASLKSQDIVSTEPAATEFERTDFESLNADTYDPYGRSSTWTPDQQVPRSKEEIAARLQIAYRDPDDQANSPNPTPRKSTARIVNWPETCFELYNALIDVDVETNLARELINDVREAANERELSSIGMLAARLRRRMAGELSVSGPISIPVGERRVVALVGPTGVGKTTTIAKLAANARLRDRRRVGLLTMDTYRIAAVDQLRSYAEIIDLPLAVATTPEEARDAVRRMNDLELILVDTAGRSPTNERQMDDLRAMLAAIGPHETHLVLAGSSSAINLAQTAEKFRPARYTHVLLTKVDEALALGHIIGATRQTGVPISYLTTGQNVPDDIETAESLLLAERILSPLAQRNAA